MRTLCDVPARESFPRSLSKSPKKFQYFLLRTRQKTPPLTKVFGNDIAKTCNFIEDGAHKVTELSCVKAPIQTLGLTIVFCEVGSI